MSFGDMERWMLHKVIQSMQKRGSSLTMEWGEDDDTWTVAWITSGVRGVGQDKDLYTALTKAGKDATEKAMQ